MSEEIEQTEESGGPVAAFREYVRSWWYDDVLPLSELQTPAGTMLAKRQSELVNRARKIRVMIEKIPSMGGVFKNGELDGLPAVALAVGVVTVAGAGSIVAVIKAWKNAGAEFESQFEIYKDGRAAGMTPKAASDMAFGNADNTTSLKVFKWLPWIVIGLGTVYWFGFRKGLKNE